jgi:predicted aspartyl protease
MMPAPIEHVEEFDISKYIRDLPCGLSIGQASAHIPKYRSAMLKSVRRTREANYADNESTVTTFAQCTVKIDGEKVEAIIDSGAASSIISKALSNRLGYPPTLPSEIVIVTANGAKVRPLGEIEALPIQVGKIKVYSPCKY